MKNKMLPNIEYKKVTSVEAVSSKEDTLASRVEGMVPPHMRNLPPDYNFVEPTPALEARYNTRKRMNEIKAEVTKNTVSDNDAMPDNVVSIYSAPPEQKGNTLTFSEKLRAFFRRNNYDKRDAA